MQTPCFFSSEPEIATATIVGCGSVLDSTTPSFTITIEGATPEQEQEALSNAYELWWTDQDPNDPNTLWIDEKDPVVLGTLPGGMGTYNNFPSDGSPVTLRLRCLPDGLDPTVDSNWIEADQCEFISVNENQAAFIVECGEIMTTTAPVFTIDGPDSDIGNIYDIRRSTVSANGPWVDPADAVVANAFPVVSNPISGFPSDGSQVWLSLWCRDPNVLGSVFEIVDVCSVTAPIQTVNSSLCIESQLVRAFDVEGLPSSVINSTGKPSFDINDLSWRYIDGSTRSITFSPGAATHTAANATQLAANIANVSPNNGVLELTADIGIFSIPASVTGIPGQYRIIDLKGFNLGTGGRSFIRGSNIAIIDTSATSSSTIGSIITVEGNDNLFIDLNDTLSFELFGPNDASPRPTDNKFFGTCFNADPDTAIRSGIKLSDSTGGTTSNALRTVISRCTFNGFTINAINGVSENDWFPRDRSESRTIIYECTFFNCDQETTTFKDDACFIYGGLTYGGSGYHSFRSSHHCALINHLHIQDRGLWLQAFGEGHAIAGNIVISNADIRVLSTITPHSIPNVSVPMNYAAQGLSKSTICDNLIFSAKNVPIRATVYIDEYIGPSSHVNWQNFMEGLDTQDNIMFNNFEFGPSTTIAGYDDATSDNRMPEAEWDLKNVQAPMSNQRAFQQNSGNPLVSTITGNPIKIGDPASPETNANGEKVIPNFWGSIPLVIDTNEKMLDGSVFSYT